MMKQVLTRRGFMHWASVATSATVLAACQPKVVEKVVKETVEVEKVVKETIEVEKIVKETVIVEKGVVPTEASTAPVAVSIMHLAHECTDDEIRLFNEKYPHIKLSRMELDEVRWYSMLAAGNPPDVKRQEGTMLPYLLVRRIPLNLQPYFDTSTIIDQDDLASTNDYWKAASPLEQGTGDRYGMIKDWTPGLVLWCNGTICERVGLPIPSDSQPMTYDELYELAARLSRREGDRTLVWGFSHSPDWMHHYWECWLEGLGKSFWSPDFDKFNLVDQEESVACIKWDFDMAKERTSQSLIDPSPRGWIGPDFMAAQVAITQFGLWFAAMIQGRMGLEGMIEGQNPIMLPAPVWKGGKEVDVDFAAMGAVVARETKHPDEAWKVNEWYHAEEPALTRATLGWGVPAFRSWYDKMPRDTDIFRQAQAVVFNQEKRGATDVVLRFSPFVKGDAIGAAFHTYFERALKDELTFKEMIDSIQRDIDTQIKEGMAILGM